MPKSPTVEDLEDFWEMLQGPVGGLLRQAGVVMARRLDERQQTLADLTDQQMMDVFQAAVLESASHAYSQTDAEAVREVTHMIFADAAMEMRANAGSTDAMN